MHENKGYDADTKEDDGYVKPEQIGAQAPNLYLEILPDKEETKPSKDRCCRKPPCWGCVLILIGIAILIVGIFIAVYLVIGGPEAFGGKSTILNFFKPFKISYYLRLKSFIKINYIVTHNPWYFHLNCLNYLKVLLDFFPNNLIACYHMLSLF